MGYKGENSGCGAYLTPPKDPNVVNRFVTIGHTETRVQELRAWIEAILQRGAMSCKDAERLRGRLQWFETFYHGRVAQQSLRVISSMASVGRKREEGDEEKLGSVGAVLVCANGRVTSFVSERVPEQWMDHFMKESRHPVFELELLPIVIALCVWEKFLRNCQSVFYLANEAARGALISGATPS